MNSFFQNLPPIADLAVAMSRLLLAGFILLTAGLVAGFLAGNVREHLVTVSWSVCVWLLYGILLLVRAMHRVSSRRIAWLSVGAFTVVLGTLMALSFIHQ